MTQIEQYIVPDSLPEALEALGANRVTILAGGTDLMLRHQSGNGGFEPVLMNIRRIPELQGISVQENRLRIGALTTVTELLENRTVAKHLPVLARTADCFAGNQIRNVATIGGNICNASPAADLTVPLLLLDAEVELASVREGSSASRSIPLGEFFLAPGSTRCEPHELLVAVHVPIPERGFSAGFEKFGTRPAMDISMVSVGIAGTRRNGGLQRPRVAFGAVAPTPMRGLGTEEAIEGRTLDDSAIADIAKVAEEEVRPITDFRASEWYRRRLVYQLTARLLEYVVKH